MAAQVLQFIGLSDAGRQEARRIGRLAKGDWIEVHIKRRDGGNQKLSLPPEAISLVEFVLDHLSQGERVAVLTEDQELSPNETANILGVSRPLVVHRMDVGELPFRYVGKHRRSTLRDILALKTKIDARSTALAVDLTGESRSVSNSLDIAQPPSIASATAPAGLDPKSLSTPQTSGRQHGGNGPNSTAGGDREADSGMVFPTTSPT